ncbi:MAG: ATP-binding protein [Bacteroidia bacterium]
MKKFDLNIEKILENWETYHAIREIIANALDEQLLTKSGEVEIRKQGATWVIRDFGRGLRYTHLTQNENQEKLKNASVIGKFGIGLKDALATFDRKAIPVTANSKHSRITIARMAKDGFEDIVTLHGIIEPPIDKKFIGTEFRLEGVSDKDIERAKSLFLRFSGERVIESTRQGQVVERKGKFGNIYINGVKVAEEENFLFSYNITVLNSQIRRALNRERTNVGRSAYTDSVKKILLASQTKEVAELLAGDLEKISKGTEHDELRWIDVQEHSVKILNQQGRYLFITAAEAMSSPDMVDEAKRGGYGVVVIPESLGYKIRGLSDHTGNPIIDFGQFAANYGDSFVYEFIDPKKLTAMELEVYQHTETIVGLFGGKPRNVAAIKISATMRKDFFANNETLGCWDERTNSIVVSRKILRSIKYYSGTLIHELVHAKTGHEDVTRDFENALTVTIGRLCGLFFEDV